MRGLVQRCEKQHRHLFAGTWIFDDDVKKRIMDKLSSFFHFLNQAFIVSVILTSSSSVMMYGTMPYM